MGELRRLYYQTKEKQYHSFKRYMFRWDGVVSGSTFQLSRLMIDDIDLPYTYVNCGSSGGSTISNEPAAAMIASTSSYTNPNNKWCMISVGSSSYGWLIFDLPDTHVIHSYRVMTANDTADDSGRNPKRIRLYGTTSEATTVSDESWVLLSDVSNSGNSSITTANRTWSSYFAVEPEEVVTGTYYLLAPSDISRGTGIRYSHEETSRRVTYNKSSATTIQFDTSHQHVMFSVLPVNADNTAFGIANNGIYAPYGCYVFWVKAYSIASDGSLTVTGVKADYNSTSCSESSSWPSPPSNKMYFYANSTVYSKSTELHKFALSVPSDSIAVLVAYSWNVSTSVTHKGLAVNTDKSYLDVRDSLTGIIQGSSYVSEIGNLAASSTATLTYPATDIIYPFSDNRVIVVGSKTSLGF